MKTLSYIFASLMIVMSAAWAYNENYRTQAALSELDGLYREIAREKASLTVLQAEWAYLNRPDRLRKLAELHFDELQLMSLSPDHFGMAGLIPNPVADSTLYSALQNPAPQRGAE